jgi:hypothetical protein
MGKIKIDDFDTIIVDLDFTVWHGCRDKFWAKKLRGALTLDYNYIYDTNSDYIRIDSDFRLFIKQCYNKNKKLGYITRGGLQDTPYIIQPPVICLKMFDVYNFFNYEKHVLWKTDKKSQYIKPHGKTLYIDDNLVDLEDIDSILDVDITTLNRDRFKSWRYLLS